MNGPRSMVELERVLDDCIAGRPFISKQQKFGFPAWVIGGQLLAGVTEDGLVFNLSEEGRRHEAERLPDLVAWKGNPVGGQRDYAMLPGQAPDPAIVAELIWRSLAYVETMQPMQQRLDAESGNQKSVPTHAPD